MLCFFVLKTFVQEGCKSLYKGVTPPLISLSFLNTVSFTSYNFFRHHLGAKRGWDYRNAIAGVMVGPFIASPVSTVEHFVKVRHCLHYFESEYR